MSATRQVRMVAVSKLRPHRQNARTHSKKQIRQIAESIQQFGWTYPVLTDEDGNVVAGHGRLKAAELLKLREVPVIVVSGLTEAKRRALTLADNKIAENAGWDRAILASELSELALLLPECNLGIAITGFEPPEIDSLMGDLADREDDPADEMPVVAPQAVSRLGDLWLLGPHRLFCGDATKASDVGKVMGNDLADMVFTDPPYNVRISSIQGRGRIRHREFVAASGEMSRKQFTRFLTQALSCAARHSVKGSIHFACQDWRHMREMLSAGEEVYTELKNLVVWNKTNAGQGSFYRSQYELIFVWKNGDAPHVNNFELGQHGRNRTNVWTYAGVNTFRSDRLKELAAHPTVKPVAMVADAMRDCSRRGDIVLDPFVGSGTTVLAAERVGRRAYALDLDPRYVDVAVRRWQAFTKRDAILDGTRTTFNELAGGRPSRDRRRAK